MDPIGSRQLILVLTVGLAFVVCAATAVAEEGPQGGRPAGGPPAGAAGGPPGGKGGGPPPGLTGPGLELRGALFRQFETDVADGGRFAVTRAVVNAGFRYAWEPTRSVGLGLGYRSDRYSFGGEGLFGAGPWSEVHSLRLAAPVLWSFDERWMLFAVPTLRSTVEEGASLEDGVSGGVLGGISYRFSKNLSLGPGFGVLTQIEDDPSFFPIVLVDWKITPTLTLRTGRGLGSTQGPGVFLNWKASKTWELSLGGRYERNRFRLDDRGVAPGGVGEESSFAVVAGIRYSLDRTSSFSFSAGFSFAGELSLDDEGGRRVDTQDFDPVFFLGLGFDVRF